MNIKVKYKMLNNSAKYDKYYSPVSKEYGDRREIYYPCSYKSVSHSDYSIEVVRTLVSVSAYKDYGVLTLEQRNNDDCTNLDNIKPSTVKPVYEYVVYKNGKAITENIKTAKECKSIIKSLIEKESA